MVLPMIMAMTAAEIAKADPLPGRIAWMACHFSPYSQGLSNLPGELPPGSVLILDDRWPWDGHSADLTAAQLAEAAARLECAGVLLDFLRPPESATRQLAQTLAKALPCPLAVPPDYIRDLDCAVFLPPGSLHRTPESWIKPWLGREIWLEAALGHEILDITEAGAICHPALHANRPSSGLYAADLCCHYRTELLPDRIRFTLFDTRESLRQRLEVLQGLGVNRFVGLWQELRE